MKKYAFLLLMLFFINTTYAVEVHCGSRYINNGVFTGDYIFVNTDNSRVKVYIDNKFSLINIYPSNNFYLEPGESKIISFRAYTAIYDALPVMYTDTINGFTASLVCRYYAMPEGSYITVLTTTTTTNVVNYNYDCRNKGFYNCVSLPGCTWVGGLFSGYCKSLYEEQNNETTTTVSNTITTITTTSITTTTSATTTISNTITTPASTTTIADTCKLLNFWQCQSNSACKWSGDFKLGKCVQNSQYTTTTSTTTTTTTTTTTSTTTTTLCSTVCTRWLRLVCLEWKTVCVL